MEIAYKPFGGDKLLKEEFERLIKRFSIKTIIETGTYVGDTTKELSTMVKSVHTIETNKQFYDIAKWNCRNLTNVTFHLGSSPEIIERVLPMVIKPVLFFLDAHWFNYWPILDELKVIGKKGGKNSVIVIHDFYVPGKNFGYDSYVKVNGGMGEALGYLDALLRLIAPRVSEIIFKKQRLDWNYIKKSIVNINPEYKHFYNKKGWGGDERSNIYNSMKASTL